MTTPYPGIPNIGPLVKDENSTSIQIGSAFEPGDGASTHSPFTASGSPQELVIPQGAVELIIMDISNDLKVSLNSSVSRYDLVTKGNKESFPCARLKSIWVQGTGGDTVYFRFTIV